MILKTAFLLVVLASPQESDTLSAIEEVRTELKLFYDRTLHTVSGTRNDRIAILGTRCDADVGSECFNGDPDTENCRADSPCLNWPPRWPLEVLLLEQATTHPNSGFLMGQATYLLLKAKNPQAALQLLEGCEAEGWWCSALKGMVFQRAGRPQLAEDEMRAFITNAPELVRCDLDDSTWLVGRLPIRRWSGMNQLDLRLEFRRSWQGRSCDARLRASQRINWLSDPLYLVDGNDRWTEMMSEAVESQLEDELASTTSRRPRDYREEHRARINRRGPWDSWEMGADQTTWWTSLRAARYHFVPDFQELADLSDPVWTLQSDYELEGYTPAYAPFYAAAVQIARFRSETAALQRIAAATSVAGTPIESAVESGYLVFTDAPESFPLQLEAQFQDARAVYLPDAEPKPYVASFEILTAEGIGWHREQIQPLALEGEGVSDLLLYRPVGMEEPISLLAAAALMHGSTEVEAAEQGLFWEVYGAPEGTPIEFSLEIRSEETGGLMNQVRRLFGGASERDATLSWSEPSQGPQHARAIILDFRDLEPGEYTVALRATWGENDAIVTADRSVSVR